MLNLFETIKFNLGIVIPIYLTYAIKIGETKANKNLHHVHH